MTGIPVHVPARPQPKPTCYICGNPCIDAGDQGRIVRHMVRVNNPRQHHQYQYRNVRACANCRPENEDG